MKGNSVKKKLRKPPQAPQLNDWINEGDSQGNKASSVTQVTSNPATQVTDNLVTQVTEKESRPKGPGIVKRADGSYKRRLVVYISPDNARRLKAASAMDGRDMSDIVDDLVGEWLS